jgi:hypothetical protein
MMLKDGEITVTHPTGEYTQMSESGLIHFIPQPIYTTSPLPANTQGFESGSIPSGWVLGRRCSIVSGQARTGTYCLAMIGNNIDSSYWYVDFYVTQDNTTVSFWYRRTSSSSSNWSFGVALDGVYKGSLGHTTSWTQFTITGVSKGMHELRCYAVDVDSYTDTIYFDDFVFEANPVTYNLVGYNPAIGYEHIYGVYIGQYTTNALGVITTSIPQAWIQLPEWMKNKDIKVFLSLTNISYTTTTHLKLLKIDNTVPAFKVEAYAEDQYYNLRPLEFTYFVLV